MIGSEKTVWPPDDGRKDSRNILRNYWLQIKSLIVASSWSHLYLLIKDARSFEYKICILIAGTFLWKSCRFEMVRKYEVEPDKLQMEV